MAPETVKNTTDVLAGFTILGTFANWLPNIAALLAIIWTIIRIYEWARVAIWGKPRRDIV